MTTTDKEIVSQSYGICCMSPKFFDDFYDAFLATSPAIAPKFANTDMARQKQLLREGISFMIMYYADSGMGQMKVKSLGASHAQDRLDIAPAMYDFWLSALLKTVARHDPNYSPTHESAWRNVMGKGIAAMRAMYAAKKPVGV